MASKFQATLDVLILVGGGNSVLRVFTSGEMEARTYRINLTLKHDAASGYPDPSVNCFDLSESINIGVFCFSDIVKNASIVTLHFRLDH